MALTIIIGVGAIIFMAFGFWKSDIVLWVVDTILWFVWTYLAIDYVVTSATPGTNTYLPTAIGLIGIAVILTCIYKDITTVIAMMRSRPHQMTPSEQYEDDKRRNHAHLYNITHRRY